MNRALFLGLLCLLFFGSLGITLEPPAEPELQGSWKGDKASVSNKKRPGAFEQTWSFKKGTISIHKKLPGGGEDDIVWKYKVVDERKEPRMIDFIPGNGSASGKTLKGIYSISNKGKKLLIAYPVPSLPNAEIRERPTSLEEKQENVMVITFQRTD